MYNSTYFNHTTFSRMIDNAVKILQSMKFDTIVFRGFSGATVAPTIAYKLGKAWALVRKPYDNSHSTNRIEGSIRGKYVIIDDLISSGDTINKIVKECCRRGNRKCVGIYLYDEVWLREHDDYAEKKIIRERINNLPIINWEE